MLEGISIWQLLILLVVVVMVFGTKRLRDAGGDLGHALKSFRSAMTEDEANNPREADSQAGLAITHASRVGDQDTNATAPHSADQPSKQEHTH